MHNFEFQMCRNCAVIHFTVYSYFNFRPLVWLGMTTLLRFELTKTLKIDESILQNWLTLIEANYHTENSYHNSSHAADVLQVYFSFFGYFQRFPFVSVLLPKYYFSWLLTYLILNSLSGNSLFP